MVPVMNDPDRWLSRRQRIYERKAAAARRQQQRKAIADQLVALRRRAS